MSSNATAWVVIGGADKGGIIVREEESTTSTQLPERLATGAVIEEEELLRDRLRYRKLEGTGPAAGWVSVRVGNKDLVVRKGALSEAKLQAAQKTLRVPEEIPPIVTQVLSKHAQPLSHDDLLSAKELRSDRRSACLDAIIEQIGDRRWVLLGEATHGTHEFYTLRAELTRRLIEERGFRTVAVEGEWNACFRVNRFLRRRRDSRLGGAGPDDPSRGTFPSTDGCLAAALEGFDEFPEWMWRNTETRSFLEWLADFNEQADEAVRWYGLDLQGSLQAPAEEAIRYAERLDPDFAAELRRDLAPFFRHKASDLGRFLATREAGERRLAQGLTPPEGDWQQGVNPAELQAKLESLLATMQRRNRDDFAFMCPVEEALSAEQSLDVLLSGQEYYRKRFSDSGVTWNLRDQHMASMVMRLAEHLEVHSVARPDTLPPGVVIWAHNSHIGDARASDRAKAVAHWNLGHMIRETFGDWATFLLGFSTYEGEVHAAADWGDPGQTFSLQRPVDISWEAAFHAHVSQLQKEDPAVAGFVWPCGETRSACPEVALHHRLIGCVYRPETEKEAHNTVAELSAMYDAILHLETTTPIQPELEI